MTIDETERPRLEHLAQFTEVDEATWGVLETLGRAFHIQDPSLQATLEAILHVAVQTVEGTDFAGVNLMIGDRFEPQAVLGAPPNALDALQQRSGVGPCIDSARTQTVIRADDLSRAENWPEYGALAVSLGVHSIICTPMWVDDQRLGSISLYSRVPAAFDHVAERLAGLLGTNAAVALADARRRENLSIALRNRDVIGQAKGILMERYRITSDAAFELLSRVSQRSNRKLAIIAEEVAATGVLEQ